MKQLNMKFYAFALVIGLASCTQNDDPIIPTQVNMTASLATMQQTVSNLPTEPLDDAEKARILFIREEEKLAYDVYQTMFDIYGVSVFQSKDDTDYWMWSYVKKTNSYATDINKGLLMCSLDKVFINLKEYLNILKESKFYIMIDNGVPLNG